jgi:IrrE N-terminal-like domain
MFVELEARWQGGAEQLAADTVDALSGWGAIEVRMEPAADVGCSVAGAYLYDNVRPIVAIAESASPGRRAFTGGHELGHHLQQTTDHLIEALLKPDVDSHALEEAACNSFAAQLLIPEHLTATTSAPRAQLSATSWTCGALDMRRDRLCARGPRSDCPHRDMSCCSTATGSSPLARPMVSSRSAEGQISQGFPWWSTSCGTGAPIAGQRALPTGTESSVPSCTHKPPTLMDTSWWWPSSIMRRGCLSHLHPATPAQLPDRGCADTAATSSSHGSARATGAQCRSVRSVATATAHRRKRAAAADASS